MLAFPEDSLNTRSQQNHPQNSFSRLTFMKHSLNSNDGERLGSMPPSSTANPVPFLFSSVPVYKPSFITCLSFRFFQPFLRSPYALSYYLTSFGEHTPAARLRCPLPWPSLAAVPLMKSADALKMTLKSLARLYHYRRIYALFTEFT